MAELKNRGDRGSPNVELQLEINKQEEENVGTDEIDEVEALQNQTRGPLISISKSQHEFKYDSQATQPFFNNQNTILMVARSCNGDLMLMHETRIFYFSYLANTIDAKHAIDTVMADDINYAQAADHMTSLILGMLTVRKYRLLTSFYLLWHILDYAMLIALFGLLFFSKEHDSFSHIIWNYIWIFIVLLIEIFYDVLEFLVKIWILNRVSIYIGFILCILYAVTFAYYGILTDITVLTLFILRVIAYIFENIIDFCIDLEIEYDLNERTIHKLDIPFCLKSQQKERLALLHVSNHNELQLANNWQFKGTKCAWTSENVFKAKLNHYDMNLSYRCPFNFMFAITYCIIGIPLIICMTLSVILLTITRRCCCCSDKDNTILDECCHRYSY